MKVNISIPKEFINDSDIIEFLKIIRDELGSWEYCKCNVKSTENQTVECSDSSLEVPLKSNLRGIEKRDL